MAPVPEPGTLALLAVGLLSLLAYASSTLISMSTRGP